MSAPSNGLIEILTVMANFPDAAHAKDVQIPEWEHEAVNKTEEKQKDAKRPYIFASGAFATKFDSLLPPEKRYFGLSRKVFLWIFLALVLALLILIIGLAAGLSSGSR